MMSRVSLLLLALVIWFSSAVSAAVIQLDEIIAIVNDEAITYSEYEVRYRRQQIQNNQDVGQIPDGVDFKLLRLLVDERIQAQAAQARGISISPEEVNRILVSMAEQNKITPDELFEELESKGISSTDFMRSIEEQRLIQRIIDLSVNSRINVSEQEIDYHLQANKELNSSNEAYEISHLFVSISGKSDTEVAATLENVNFIHQGLQQGQPFDQAVADFSDGEKRAEGGYWGWRKEDQRPELFLKELRETQVGDITGVIKSENGFHIIKLHGKEGDEKIVTQQLVRHILVQPQRRNLTESEALEILNDIANEIRGGGDFEKFARLNSDDESSGQNGGSLGWINPGDTAPEFEQIALKLPLNQISDPVQSQFGFHLIEVLDRRTRDISQDLTRENARSIIFQRKSAELYRNWIDRLRDGAYIEYIVSN